MANTTIEISAKGKLVCYRKTYKPDEYGLQLQHKFFHGKCQIEYGLQLQHKSFQKRVKSKEIKRKLCYNRTKVNFLKHKIEQKSESVQ
jgi:hypothetical protein